MADRWDKGTPWDGIDTDTDRLADELSQADIPRSRNILGIDPSVATCEFLRYASCYDRSLADIERKVSHSLRVALLCNRLAGGEDGSDGGERADVGAMTLAGLLHDIGRFPQYAMHGAYRDYENGCDHGRLAHELLTRFGMLGRFVDIDVTCGDEATGYRSEATLSSVLTAIRLHNKRSLPDRMGAGERLYARLLRDADIVDILDIAASPTGMPHDPKVATEAASPHVMGAVRARQTVDRARMANDTDILISRMALAFAVEGRRARRTLRSRGSWEAYLVGRDISGDARADIEEARGIIAGHLG